VIRFFDRLGYSERRGPGVMGFLVARERHIDEFLLSCLQKGLDQLVILGAGYDSRAYRIPQLQSGVKVFEVDQPATQQVKLNQLRRILDALPAHVTFVPVDFNTQSLADRLAQVGYDERLVTLFIWQGVTPYLTPSAVDDTLAFIAHHSAPRSAVIFDYMYTSLLDGSQKHGEVRKMQRDPILRSELLAFGIPEGTITSFLSQRGFTEIRDADHAELHRLYFHGPNRARKVAHGYAIVSARVA
jgi:methyltransferase (TIGR00027 family)